MSVHLKMVQKQRVYKFQTYNKMELCNNDLMDDTFMPVAAENDDTACYLCSIDRDNQILRVLDNLDSRLVGRCKNIEIFKTMCKCYQDNIQTLKQQNIKVKTLTVKDFEIHYTQHNVTPTRHILNDLESINHVMDILKRNHLLVKDSDGETSVNSGQLKLFKQMGTWKLDLLKAWSNYSTDDLKVVQIEPYSFK